jgi:hypothetical protein
MFDPIVFELTPDVDFKVGPSLTTIVGNFRATTTGTDTWTWSTGWLNNFSVFGSTTSPVSGTPTDTNAQKFTGSPFTTTPTGTGTLRQIMRGTVRVGYVFIDTATGQSQWWRANNTTAGSGLYFATPTDSSPLVFSLASSAVNGSYYKGINY